ARGRACRGGRLAPPWRRRAAAPVSSAPSRSRPPPRAETGVTQEDAAKGDAPPRAPYVAAACAPGGNASRRFPAGLAAGRGERPCGAYLFRVVFGSRALHIVRSAAAGRGRTRSGRRRGRPCRSERRRKRPGGCLGRSRRPGPGGRGLGGSEPARAAGDPGRAAWPARSRWGEAHRDPGPGHGARPRGGGGFRTGGVERMSYVELRARSAFSFGDGAVTPEALVARAAEYGYAALGLTDTADLGGVIRFVLEAERQGLKPIVGAELRVDGYPVAFLARNEEGYRNLAALVTRSRVGDLRVWEDG